MGCTVFTIYNVDLIPDVDILELFEHLNLAREIERGG